MYNISWIRQSSFPWHFLRMEKFLWISLLLVLWVDWRCLLIAEFGSWCSSMRWNRCRVVYPTYPVSHSGHSYLYTTHCSLTMLGFGSEKRISSAILRLLKIGWIDSLVNKGKNKHWCFLILINLCFYFSLLQFVHIIKRTCWLEDSHSYFWC